MGEQSTIRGTSVIVDRVLSSLEEDLVAGLEARLAPLRQGGGRERVIEAALSIALAGTPADRAYFFSCEEGLFVIEACIARDGPLPGKGRNPPTGHHRRAIMYAMGMSRPWLARNLDYVHQARAGAEAGRPPLVEDAKAVICVPVQAQGNVAGVLSIDTRLATGDLELRDAAYMGLLAEHLAAVLESLQA